MSVVWYQAQFRSSDKVTPPLWADRGAWWGTLQEAENYVLWCRARDSGTPLEFRIVMRSLTEVVVNGASGE